MPGSDNFESPEGYEDHGVVEEDGSHLVSTELIIEGEPTGSKVWYLMIY